LANSVDENALSLAEFVKLPTTVEFHTINTDRFQQFTKERPYIKVGPELLSGLVPVYTNKENIQNLFEELGSDFIGFFPKVLSPLEQQSNDAAGISPVIEHPYLNLSGKGVIIGFVDTGIDYTKDVFINEDGTSKIISIWDQTIDGERSPDLYYGAEFSRAQINEALKSENPFSVVPSTDTDGHGTFMASVAAGRETENYIGAAPGAEIIVVKLRRANEFYIDKYLLPPEEPNLFLATDILLGSRYIFTRAQELNLPVVLCIGMGSNLSGHDGNTPLEEYFSTVAQRIGYAIVTAAGNESNAKHHTEGTIPRTGSTDVISIRVGESMSSFTVGIFGASYDRISVGITSPTGEVISRVPFKVGMEVTEELTIDKTVITIGYYKDVNTVIILGLKNAKEGIWEITLYGDSILSGTYHAWLPITGQVSPWVEFMKPVPEYTTVFPANSLRTITCGAYNSNNNTLYVSSSWGPTRLPRMAPDFVAPGVNVSGVYPTGVGTMTGTSVAAAITAGAVAILMEWGIVQGNMKSLDGDITRLLLISGCTRDEGILYPNTRWGYGKLNLYGTFSKIKETSIVYDVREGTL
jgi:subtilisin family serine protease